MSFMLLNMNAIIATGPVINLIFVRGQTRRHDTRLSACVSCNLPSIRLNLFGSLRDDNGANFTSMTR